jgi:hypothetical protein
MDIKRKTCDIRTWKICISRISSTNIDTLVPSLYQCVETRSMEVFLTVASAISSPLFQPLRHQRNVCHRVVNRFTRQTLPTVNRKHFFMNILCTETFCLQKTTTRGLCFSVRTRQARSAFWLLKPASEHAHAHLPPRLSWSWSVLLPSDTHRKTITSITGDLLPFVTY